MEKVQILGAGPAGLSAAINLAKVGYDVDIFEKNADVGSRFHGDFQGLENWSDDEDVLSCFKNMNIDVNFECTPFKKLSISNESKMWDFNCNRPAFYLIKRGNGEDSLDQGLKNQAYDIGVNIYFKETIPENEADIIATGPIKNELFAAAKGITFETSHENLAVGLVNNKSSLNGYSYLLISEGYGCMATVLFNNFNNANSYFEETKGFFNSKFDLNLKELKNMGGVGCFSSKNVFKCGKSLYVGEAAGLQDFLWGFGIKTSVISGYMAANSIINGKNYESTAKNYFNGKVKASLVNRYLWERFGFLDYSFIVNRIHKAENPLKFLNYFYNHNFVEKLIYPVALRYMRRKYKNLRL